jgi:hypothetical protein
MATYRAAQHRKLHIKINVLYLNSKVQIVGSDCIVHGPGDKTTIHCIYCLHLCRCQRLLTTGKCYSCYNETGNI